MDEEKSLGQVAYEAYRRWHCRTETWRELKQAERAAWEAAAQAAYDAACNDFDNLGPG